MKSNYGEFVSVALDGRHVAIVEIDAPPLNYASNAMVEGLADALEALELENDCRAIVLASAGKTFCAGADLAGPSGMGAQGMGVFRTFYDTATRLFATSKPIVGAIQGAAVGAGLGLALVPDFRVAAPEARFSANFVKLGFHAGFGLTKTLPRAIGHQRADLMFLTGRRIKAEEALQWGLVEQVVPLQELRAAAAALAREIAENAPLAVSAIRQTMRGDLARIIREQAVIEFEKQSMLRATDDYAEGLRAVAERRPGNFAGR